MVLCVVVVVCVLPVDGVVCPVLPGEVFWATTQLAHSRTIENKNVFDINLRASQDVGFQPLVSGGRPEMGIRWSP